jgi:dihydrofolate synthase / folylpolyglutamate synthase
LAVSFERYHEAVDYLQRRLWHELPIVPVERALQARIRQLLAYFGDPHKVMPVVHVGGSAGKGSTSTIIASILQTAGLRTGLYTSPHLQTFIERAAVDRVLIAPDEFADTVLGLEPLVRQMHLEVIDGVGFGRPSLVEVAFATCMRHFASERCDAAVVEVGLGGRTDCTNVFEQKPVTVLTNVEFEHRERLGWTRAAIAREKSKTIIGGEIVLAGALQPEAMAVVQARCDATGATLWRLGHEVRISGRNMDVRGGSFDLRTPRGVVRGLRVPLLGEHQVTNAAMAGAAAIAFATNTGREISDRAIACGLESVRLSGRLERVQEKPFVLLDAAHNPVEARHLAQTLRTQVLSKNARLHLVCGILADKDQPSMVRALAPVATRVTVTQPPLTERAGDPSAMVALFERALGAGAVAFEADAHRALERAIADAKAGDVICVTGSMFLVGALRERWVPEERILSERSAAL